MGRGISEGQACMELFAVNRLLLAVPTCLTISLAVSCFLMAPAAAQNGQGHLPYGEYKLRTPPAYYQTGSGGANAVGLAVIPTLHGGSDSAEAAVEPLTGHIPGITMSIKVPANNPEYMFKFINHLKSQGKVVNLLMLGGHAQQPTYIDGREEQVNGISFGENRVLRPTAFDPNEAEKAIKAALARNDMKEARRLCENFKMMQSAAKAMAPGAEIILHSCYTGSSLGKNFSLAFAKALLAEKGGTLYAPYGEIGSVITAQKPGFIAGNQARAQQIVQLVRNFNYIQPGDAVVSNAVFASLVIPAGNRPPALPASCACLEKPAVWWSCDGAVTLGDGGWRDKYDVMHGSLGGSSIDFTFETPSDGSTGEGHLKLTSKPGQPLKYEGYKMVTYKRGKKVETPYKSPYYVQQEQ